jgi:hypothetical protein
MVSRGVVEVGHQQADWRKTQGRRQVDGGIAVRAVGASPAGW